MPDTGTTTALTDARRAFLADFGDCAVHPNPVDAATGTLRVALRDARAAALAS